MDGVRSSKQDSVSLSLSLASVAVFLLFDFSIVRRRNPLSDRRRLVKPIITSPVDLFDVFLDAKVSKLAILI